MGLFFVQLSTGDQDCLILEEAEILTWGESWLCLTSGNDWPLLTGPLQESDGMGPRVEVLGPGSAQSPGSGAVLVSVILLTTVSAVSCFFPITLGSDFFPNSYPLLGQYPRGYWSFPSGASSLLPRSRISSLSSVYTVPWSAATGPCGLCLGMLKGGWKADRSSPTGRSLFYFRLLAGSRNPKTVTESRLVVERKDH